MKKLPLVFFLVACTPAAEPDPVPDAGDPTCASVCARWKVLSCKEAEPTPNGASCTEVCINLVSSGVVKLDLQCRAAVASCDAIDACEE